jgi:aarF domain-containing kinase
MSVYALVGSGMAARLTVDEKETTELVLEIVSVAEKNGLKLPREFGLLLKQVMYLLKYLRSIHIAVLLG